MSFLHLPKLVDPSSGSLKEHTMLPGLINETTVTGEQRAMLDGLIRETRPDHKVNHHAPGLPTPKKDHEPPLMKVTPSKTKSAMGMTHIRGTKY